MSIQTEIRVCAQKAEKVRKNAVFDGNGALSHIKGMAQRGTDETSREKRME